MMRTSWFLLILLLFAPVQNTVTGIIINRGNLPPRFLQSFQGGSQETSKEEPNEEPLIMMRMQYPNGKIERLEFSPDDPLSKLSETIGNLYKANGACFKSHQLLDLSIELQGRCMTLKELKQQHDRFVNFKFKHGEWILFKPIQGKPTIETSSATSVTTTSRSTKAKKLKRPKFQSLGDIEKYKRSLIRFSKKESKKKPLPIVYFPSNWISFSREIFQSGGIQLLFGSHDSGTNSTPGSYQILGGCNLWTGDLLSTSVPSLAWEEKATSEGNWEKKIQSISSLLNECNLKIIGVSICTHPASITRSNSLSSWNRLMFLLAAWILQHLPGSEAMMIVSVSRQQDSQSSSSSKTTIQKKSPKQSLHTSEEYRLEGYCFHPQVYSLLQQQIIQPVQELQSIFKQISSQSKLNWEQIELTQPILIGNEDVDQIDVQLLSRPVPIQLISYPNQVIPFRRYFEVSSSSSSATTGKEETLLKRQRQKFLKDLLTKIGKMKSIVLSTSSSSPSSESQEVVAALRDLALLEHLSSVVPSHLFKRLVQEIVAYNSEERQLLQESHVAKAMAAETEVVLLDQSSSSKRTSSVNVIEKKLSKALQMEINLYLQTLPEESVHYQGEESDSKQSKKKKKSKNGSRKGDEL